MVLNKEDSLAFAKWLTSWPIGAYRVLPNITTGHGSTKTFHCMVFWEEEPHAKSAWSEEHWRCMREEALAQEAGQKPEQGFAPTHLLGDYVGPVDTPVEVLFKSDQIIVVREEDGVEYSRSTGCVKLEPYKSHEDVLKGKLLEKWKRQSLDDAYDNYNSTVKLGRVFDWLIKSDLIAKGCDGFSTK